ncbi:MAG: hypothetical protein AAGA84_05590 [Pseudomonadota bacterium]
MTNFVVPTVEDIQSLLSIIVGEGLDVKEIDSDPSSAMLTATYIDDSNVLVGLCGADIHLAAYLSAALSLLPKPVADEQIKAGELNEQSAANFYEVMNICSKLFMSDESAHLRLDKTLLGADAQAPVDELNGEAVHKTYSMEIPNYGNGIISFAVT